MDKLTSIDEVMALLKANENPRGIANWQKLGKTNGLKSFGIGLTQLRKLAKTVGKKNHGLSQALWQTDVYDAKVIALLIDDPKQISKQQAEKQVDELNAGMLVHVFSSCDATLAKSPIAFELANEWLASKDDLRRRSAYGLLYELSKNQRHKSLTDAYFLDCLADIEVKIFDEAETPTMRFDMGVALMGIGKRNRVLHQRALGIARAVGPIDFNEDGGKCDPFDPVKHLTSDYLLAKLGVSATS